MSSKWSTFIVCGILVTMEPPRRRIQYTVHDDFTLFEKEKDVYLAIVKETILQNKRCAQLSLSDLSDMTGIARSSVDHQLKKLQRRRLIEINKTQKTNTICIELIYKEILG